MPGSPGSCRLLDHPAYATEYEHATRHLCHVKCYDAQTRRSTRRPDDTLRLAALAHASCALQAIGRVNTTNDTLEQTRDWLIAFLDRHGADQVPALPCQRSAAHWHSHLVGA